MLVAPRLEHADGVPAEEVLLRLRGEHDRVVVMVSSIGDASMYPTACSGGEVTAKPSPPSGPGRFRFRHPQSITG